MMTSLGHDVYLYSSDENDANVKEHINVIPKELQDQFWGDNDTHKEFFKIDWDPKLPYWQFMNSRASVEIKKRLSPNDYLCLIGGLCQESIAKELPDNICVEYGIGYEGVFSNFCVFESYAWMHYVYGHHNVANGRYYDAVIPNYYDVNDFPLRIDKEDYLLAIGRVTQRKGLEVASEVAKRTGRKLVVVGQGASVSSDGKTLNGDWVDIDCDFEYLGVITDPVEKAEVIGKAHATMVHTQYIGPFEGVHVESMLCGTPVITTDWGVFTETVRNGFNGFRTRTLGEAVWATEQAQTLSPRLISDYAVNRWSMDVVKFQFEAYFEQLETLRNDGWYSNWYGGIENERYR